MLSPAASILKLTEYTEQVKALFSGLAVRHNINIIGGSHPTQVEDGDIHNVCYVCLRDGSIHPGEDPSDAERATWWNIKGGDRRTHHRDRLRSDRRDDLL